MNLNPDRDDSLRFGRWLAGTGVLFLLATFVASIVWMAGLNPGDDRLLAPGVPGGQPPAATAPAPALPVAAKAAAPVPALVLGEEPRVRVPYPAGGRLNVYEERPEKPGKPSQAGDL